MDKDELIQELTDACQNLMQMVDELKEENAFLTDTICNQKMATITTERRQMQAKVIKAETDSKNAVAEADAIKSEYEQKLDKITAMIQDITLKQSDINSYINSEAEAKIASIKNDCSKALAKHKAKKDALLQEQLNKYKKQHKVIITCGIIGVIIGVLGIIF